MKVTQLLEKIRDGDMAARDALINLVYEDLRKVANKLMIKERRNHTLQATAVLHEAMARLIAPQKLDKMVNRPFFFAAAARSMRQVLVDHAKAKNARDGKLDRVTLDVALDALESRDLDVLGLDDALKDLNAFDRLQHDAIELRFFGGLTMREIAEALGKPTQTIQDKIRFATAWLRHRMEGGGL